MHCPVCTQDGGHPEVKEDSAIEFAMWQCPSCQFKWMGPTPREIAEYKETWREYLRNELEDRAEQNRQFINVGIHESDSDYADRKLREKGGFL